MTQIAVSISSCDHFMLLHVEYKKSENILVTLILRFFKYVYYSVSKIFLYKKIGSFYLVNDLF